jgi:hypothetical protein
MVSCLLGAVAVSAEPVGAITKSQLQAKTLSLSDLPTGWSVDNSSSGGGSANVTGCFRKLVALGPVPKGLTRARVEYVMKTLPQMDETLETGKGAPARYIKYRGILRNCKSVSYTASDGTTVKGSVGAMSFPPLGDSSSAYAINLTASGVSLGIDVVLFRAGSITGQLLYFDFSPDATVVQEYATAAVNKVEGKPVTIPTSS